ncbi:MAG: hypothetical protein WC565_02175 [Parcubacteria group bacterium]
MPISTDWLQVILVAFLSLSFLCLVGIVVWHLMKKVRAKNLKHLLDLIRTEALKKLPSRTLVSPCYNYVYAMDRGQKIIGYIIVAIILLNDESCDKEVVIRVLSGYHLVFPDDEKIRYKLSRKEDRITLASEAALRLYRLINPPRK